MTGISVPWAYVARTTRLDQTSRRSAPESNRIVAPCACFSTVGAAARTGQPPSATATRTGTCHLFVIGISLPEPHRRPRPPEPDGGAVTRALAGFPHRPGTSPIPHRRHGRPRLRPFRGNREFGWHQFRTIPSLFHRFDADLAGAPAGLQDHLRQAVE